MGTRDHLSSPAEGFAGQGTRRYWRRVWGLENWFLFGNWAAGQSRRWQNPGFRGSNSGLVRDRPLPPLTAADGGAYIRYYYYIHYLMRRAGIAAANNEDESRVVVLVNRNKILASPETDRGARSIRRVVGWAGRQ
ncbi:hypothetical protein PG984_001770 [Apiospora sp. TS-2023a]